jgi:hypothetical protein
MRRHLTFPPRGGTPGSYDHGMFARLPCPHCHRRTRVSGWRPVLATCECGGQFFVRDRYVVTPIYRRQMKIGL